MEFGKPVVCTECQKPILRGEGLGFVYFKIPGKEGYYFFHCRLQGGDCWEAYLKERK